MESFNQQLLSYVPKRIHFGTMTFKIRLNLACMDWVSSFQVIISTCQLYKYVFISG